jgi:hypothetical protein
MMEQHLRKPWKVKYKAMIKSFEGDYLKIQLQHIRYDLWRLDEPIWPY